MWNSSCGGDASVCNLEAQVLELTGPRDVPVFQWLTGWLCEDVLPRLPQTACCVPPSATEVQYGELPGHMVAACKLCLLGHAKPPCVLFTRQSARTRLGYWQHACSALQLVRGVQVSKAFTRLEEMCGSALDAGRPGCTAQVSLRVVSCTRVTASRCN